MTNREHVKCIIRAAAKVFAVKPEEVLGDSRRTDIVAPRHVAMLVAKTDHPELSYQSLADIFCRDHTVLIYAIRKLRGRLEEGDEDLRVACARVREAADELCKPAAVI